ncbi:hypothetical protein J6590_070783 [Homalodisca vitripennis]|nr:hypothetical protein J6590_070783 [Homalodisca vitripennis]
MDVQGLTYSLLIRKKFTEDDFAVKAEVEQRLTVIEDKDNAGGEGSRDTSVAGEMDVNTNEYPTPENVGLDVGSLQNLPTIPCLDKVAQPQSKVSFKSLCPKH